MKKKVLKKKILTKTKIKTKSRIPKKVVRKKLSQSDIATRGLLIFKNLFADPKEAYSNNKSLYINNFFDSQKYLDETSSIFIATRKKFGQARILFCFSNVDYKDLFITLLKTYPKHLTSKIKVTDTDSFLKNPIKRIKLVVYIGNLPKKFVEICFRQNTLVFSVFYAYTTINHYTTYKLPIIIDSLKKIVWLLLFYKNIPNHEAEVKNEKIQAKNIKKTV